MQLTVESGEKNVMAGDELQLLQEWRWRQQQQPLQHPGLLVWVRKSRGSIAWTLAWGRPKPWHMNNNSEGFTAPE